MTGPAVVLENHALIVLDGRIVAVLPRAEAAARYAPVMVVHRPTHVLMPGLIDTAVSLTPAAPRPAAETCDAALLGIAALLRSGITCCAARGEQPQVVAATAADQGLRAVIGLPIGDGQADTAHSGLTRALALRDEYQGHPLISTAFAPRSVNAMSDASFARIATYAAELDARIMLDLHASAAEISESQASCGLRPIERLDQLGLLSPALQAVHLCHADAADLALAERSGIAVSLSPLADLGCEGRLPPVAALAASKLRLGLGSGGARHAPQELWTGMKLIAALLHSGTAAADAHATLEMATRAAAAVLGLEGEVGCLEPGKWADLCCADLSVPGAAAGLDPATQLVFGGGRDMVSDVWVAGRQLLSESALTRLDWAGVAARTLAPASPRLQG